MFSIVIPWSNRPELAETLSANRSIFERANAEVVIVNGGGDAQKLVAILNDVAGLPEMRAISLAGATFSRSLCLNLGAFVSCKDYLFLLDGDMVLGSDFLFEAAEHLRTGRRYVGITRVLESDLDHNVSRDAPDLSYLAEIVETKAYLTRDGRRAVMTNRAAKGSHPGDGLVLLTKHAMFSIGGFNASFTGWGYEDTDFQLRLQFVLGLEQVELGQATHLSHNNDARGPFAWRQNMRTASSNYSRGVYVGTLARDIAVWKDQIVELALRDRSGTACRTSRTLSVE